MAHFRKGGDQMDWINRLFDRKPQMVRIPPRQGRIIDSMDEKYDFVVDLFDSGEIYAGLDIEAARQAVRDEHAAEFQAMMNRRFGINN